MIEFVFSMLASAGFKHPLHPVMTHIPMGIIIGTFLFQIASFKFDELTKTARHCITLAFIFIPLTILFGYMDWQQRYTGPSARDKWTRKPVLRKNPAADLISFIITKNNLITCYLE